MIFFAVLVVATAAALAAVRGRDRRTAARWGLGIALAVAGVGHLASPDPFVQHLPKWVPGAGLLIAVTGLIEIGLGIALALAHSRLIGRLAAAYLVAVFPANVYVAISGTDVEGQPGGIYPWVRLPFQALFVAWALWSTTRPPTAVEPDATLEEGRAVRRHGTRRRHLALRERATGSDAARSR